MRSDADWRRYVRSHLPALNTSAEREAEVVEELAIQLSATYERAVARGATEAEARAAVEAEVPDWSALAKTLEVIETPHVKRPAPGVDVSAGRFGLALDAYHAVRSLRGWRGFPAAVAMLALAVGAATTVFVAAASWLSPPAAAGRDVALVWGTNHAVGQARDVVSGPTFIDWQRRNRSFAAMAAFRHNEMTVRAGGLTGVIGALEVTPEFFDVVRQKPVAGRSFSAQDADAGPTAMISYDLWQGRFGADPAIVGGTLMALGQPHLVVGVLPRGFRFFIAPEVVTLLRPRDLEQEPRTSYFYWVVGRLEAGVTFEAAQGDLSGVMSALEREHPAVRGWQATVEPFAAVMREPVETPLLILIVVAALVFAIGAANALSLLAAQRLKRAREFAVRAALGATRERLRRMSTIEAVGIAATGAAAGIVLAYLAIGRMQSWLPRAAAIAGSAATVELPVLSLGIPSFGFAAASALVLAFMLSLGSHRGNEPLSVGHGVAVASSRRLSKGRYWLLAGQAAVSTVLLGVAGLLLAMIAGLISTAPGFDPDRVLTMIVGRVQDLDAPARARYYTELLRRVHETPGVAAASLNDYVPLTNEDDYEGVEIPGRRRSAGEPLPREEWRRISDGYFAMMGIPIVRGRAFLPADDERGPSVVIVNQTMARKYWGDANPIGVRIRITSRPYGWSEIVGVAGDVRDAGLDQPVKPMMFVPFHRAARPVMGLFVKTAGDPDHFVGAVQEAVRAVDPARPVFEARTLQRVVRASYAVQWSTLMLASALALLALGMTLGGTYAVVSLVTASRTVEIGLRMALGASRGDVLATVLREPAGAASIGIAAGLMATWLSSHAIGGVVTGLRPLDWPIAAAVAALVVAVVLAACAGPGRYAMRIDPANALRGE